MLTRTQAKEFLQVLQSLPADKVAEVFDYLNFLRERYGSKLVDVSDSWSDQDMSDLVRASFAYAEKTSLSGEA